MIWLTLGTSIIFFTFFSITFDGLISFLIDFEVIILSTTFGNAFLLVVATFTGFSTIAGLLPFTIQLKLLYYCVLHEVGSVFGVDLFWAIFVPPSSVFSSGDSFMGVKNLRPSPKGELGVVFTLKGLFKSTIGEKGLIVIRDAVRFSDTSSRGRIFGGRISDCLLVVKDANCCLLIKFLNLEWSYNFGRSIFILSVSIDECWVKS